MIVFELKVDVWMSYGDKVICLLNNFVVIGIILICFIVVMLDENCCFYGV